MLNLQAPLGGDEFSALMDRLGPFERPPQVAVAVSGGSDSLALGLLAAEWARRHGGQAVALTVDHRLRPASTEEAERVGGWLARHGIAHHILAWTGPKPATGIQAAARQARYDLLRGWCAQAGVLHLLLAHQLEDQAETLLARLARGSGVDGLAAMPAIAAWPELRLLRPLLDIPRARLLASLRQRGQDWVEDPSNANAAFQRVRLRQLLPVLADEGMTPRRLGATARRLGQARHTLEGLVAELSARAVRLHPAGFAHLLTEPWRAAPRDVALRLLAGLCLTIGNGTLPPRLERLERLHDALHDGELRRRTFAGCVIAPAADVVLFCREPAALPAPVAVEPAPGVVRVRWDRFTLALAPGAERCEVRALGMEGWRAVREVVEEQFRLPAAVYPSLLAVLDAHGISAVPDLGYKRQWRDTVRQTLRVEEIAFTPARPLVGSGHCLV